LLICLKRHTTLRKGCPLCETARLLDGGANEHNYIYEQSEWISGRRGCACSSFSQTKEWDIGIIRSWKTGAPTVHVTTNRAGCRNGYTNSLFSDLKY